MNSKKLNRFFLALLCPLVCFGLEGETLPDQEEKWQTVYEEKFEQVENDKLPEDFFVLDGEFKVASHEGRKCLVMSGTPVGEHGILFGPRLRAESLELSFSCLGGLKSRRHNVFAGTVGGIRGLGFRVNPASREMILSAPDDWQRAFSVNWSSMEWMRLKIRAEGDLHKEKSQLTIEVCKESDPDQSVLATRLVVDGMIRSGKCAIWGFAYSEKKMCWDDLLIRTKN